MSETAPLRVGQTLIGPLFNEPMRVETVSAAGDSSWVVGLVGAQSERFRRVTMSESDLAAISILDAEMAFNGDGNLLRLGIQAYTLGIAYDFDPYFGLSISRVDPLPHQLEAVYDYLLKLARVRFLLADDAGAGKTIMAGLLIKELKLRGMCERILIVAPANLAFQWQRELKEKFDEKFFVIKGDDIRDQFGVNQWLEQKQLITSLDLAKRTEILPGLRQVQCDLIIVDEAHRMSWSPPARKTARYAPGELLRDISDQRPFLDEVRTERLTEVDRIADHVELSLTELLSKADEEIGRAAAEVDNKAQGAEGRMAHAETRHTELLARRERRRQELQQQRSLTLQAVERITSILVLPHPDRASPEVRRLRPNPVTEATARVVMEHERAQGRQVFDVSEKNLGYDITSVDLQSSDLRLIEVKGIGDTDGSVLLTPNERRVAEDRRDCYWLYVVTHCNTTPRLCEPIKDPARLQWTEVVKVAHYRIDTQNLS